MQPSHTSLVSKERDAEVVNNTRVKNKSSRKFVGFLFIIFRVFR